MPYNTNVEEREKWATVSAYLVSLLSIVLALAGFVWPAILCIFYVTVICLWLVARSSPDTSLSRR